MEWADRCCAPSRLGPSESAWLGAVGFILGAFFLLAQLPAARADYTAFVDPNVVVVTNFEGWGTSLCWWANVIGGYPNRDTYVDLAFTQLKLNIVRYNIGGGENPTNHFIVYRAAMDGFEPTNGVWNWNADPRQRWVLHQALLHGADHVEAFANSPPWWMTVSGSVTGSTNGTSNNLDTSHEDDFALYLATVVSNLTVLDGITFDTVTPMNEPQGTWTYGSTKQEGCHMSPSQQARMVSKLRPQLDASLPSAEVDAPEEVSTSTTLNSLGSYNSQTLDNVGRIASHTYGASNRNGLRNFVIAHQKPMWMTEYGDNDGSGLTMAQRIHDDLAVSWFQAWVYWQVVDNAAGWGFLRNSLLATNDPNYTPDYTINQKFYVMGQFSQFIRPGCRILYVNDNRSLAAYQPTNSTLVIVTVNNSTNTFNITYDLSAFACLPAQVSRCRTSPGENLIALSSLPLVGQQFLAPVLPQSVTTHILTNVVPAAPVLAPLAWYPFEGDAQDATGHGNDGVIFGNVSFVAGRIGAQAAEFDGSSGYVQIPRCFDNHFTIACWVRTSATAGGSQWWAGKGIVDGEVQGTADDFGLCLVNTNAGFGVGNPDTTILSTSAINDGQWHHLAATRDALTGQMQLFVDGALQASTMGPTGPKTAPPSLHIGGIQAGYSGGFLFGAIDDVQLFGRVLNPAEVGQLILSLAGARAWGDNSLGQTDLPAGLSNAVAVAAGAWHSLALRNDGTVAAWRDDSAGQCQVPPGLTNALAIAAGAYHNLAILPGGTVLAWGADYYGQTNVPPRLSNVIAISAGAWHSLALRLDGTLAAWGDNSLGETNIPAGLSNVVAIAAGGNHNLALKADGTVIAWGENTNASGDYTGQSVVPWGLTNIVSVAAGEYHSLALRRDGSVVAWGDNSQGQCNVPAALSNVVALAGGGAHTLALTADGQVAAWGANWSGQCTLPPNLSRVVAVAAGELHSLALVAGCQPPLRLLNPTHQGALFSLLVQSLNRNNYVLEYKDSLTATGWTALSTNAGNGALRVLTDPGPMGAQRFYRLRLEGP